MLDGLKIGSSAGSGKFDNGRFELSHSMAAARYVFSKNRKPDAGSRKQELSEGET